MTTAFDKLALPVQKWVRSKHWKELRPIQADATNAIFDSTSDLIVSASTAGGKTEAAFLPLISQVLDDPTQASGFDIVYIGPLKALITDQAQRLEDICNASELSVFPWHGDISQSVKSRALKKPKGILLITPESLEALFVRRGLEIPRLFSATRAVVIDELHTVLDSERGIQLRSLLTRLELAVKKSIRRVGLSATLGDMDLACSYLRPDTPETVKEISAKGGSELLVQLRGYTSGENANNISSATTAVSTHLFKHLRGKDNLVFAGSRDRVEMHADLLRQYCEDAHLPQEFYPHHASLSKDHREFVEKRLKNASLPTTAVCTSTLELGIDIGDVTCVAHIGAPFSVAALRQRLGRSGRREDEPSILRQYAIEHQLDSKSHIVDRLRLGLIRSIAMVELLINKWCEPPRPQSLHLSTLVHQILSIIAERGGAHANRIFHILCKEGPFRQVESETFLDVLRALGHPDTALIEQADDGLLLLGSKGEKIVEHYSFYAVFKTDEEFKLVNNGKELGTLPVDNMITKGSFLIFSGRRWVVHEIHEAERVILVHPAKAGVPPQFGGDPGVIHDQVIACMFELLEGKNIPAYLDATASDLLVEARSNFAISGLTKRPIITHESDSHVIATRCGTIKTQTLELALISQGFRAESHDGILIIENNTNSDTLNDTLTKLARGASTDIFKHKPNLNFEKYHQYLTADLLKKDALSCRIDTAALQPLCMRLLMEG